MNEIIASVAKYFNTRMKTPFYGLLGFWWVVFHWEYFYTLFFVDQSLIIQKTGLLKNEYMRQQFSDYTKPDFWIYLGISFSLAILLTIVMIWLMPKFVLLKAYEREQKDRADKYKVRFKYEETIKEDRTKLEKQITELETQLAKRLEATEKKIVQENKIKKVDQTLGWEEEYNTFKQSPLFTKIDMLVTCLYRYGGKTQVFDRPTSSHRNIIFELERDMLAYADSNNLVDYDRDKGIISLTTKGKFFIQRYQSSPQTDTVLLQSI